MKVQSSVMFQKSWFLVTCHSAKETVSLFLIKLSRQSIKDSLITDFEL